MTFDRRPGTRPGRPDSHTPDILSMRRCRGGRPIAAGQPASKRSSIRPGTRTVAGTRDRRDGCPSRDRKGRAVQDVSSPDGEGVRPPTGHGPPFDHDGCGPAPRYRISQYVYYPLPIRRDHANEPVPASRFLAVGSAVLGRFPHRGGRIEPDLALRSATARRPPASLSVPRWSGRSPIRRPPVADLPGFVERPPALPGHRHQSDHAKR